MTVVSSARLLALSRSGKYDDRGGTLVAKALLRDGRMDIVVDHSRKTMTRLSLWLRNRYVQSLNRTWLTASRPKT